MLRNGVAVPSPAPSTVTRSTPRAVLLAVLCLAIISLAFAARAQARQGETAPRAGGPANSETAQTSAACPGGVCGELGNGFFLPDKDPVKGTLVGGKEFFRNRHLGVDSGQQRSCAQLASVGESSTDFRNAESMEELTRNTMTEFGLKASYSSARLTAQTSVNVLTGTNSNITTTFNSTTMDITIQKYAVTLRHNSYCFSAANVDPAYLAKFEALPMIVRSRVSDPGSWAPYVNFMRTWGSHVMTEQRLGSRYQQWVSSTSSQTDVQRTLQARACAKVEGENPGTDPTGKDKRGWSIESCTRHDRASRERTRNTQFKEQQVLRGGTRAARNALLTGVTEEKLKNFINSAEDGDEVIRYGFKPVWQLFFDLYQEQCGRDNQPNSGACRNMQRAYNLQAAYEGWIAIGCPPEQDARQIGALYQGMQVADTTAQGLNIYQCWVDKTGCRSHRDCWSGRGEAQCYCYGPSCIDSGVLAVPPDLRRNTVRRNRAGGYRDGVNNSCYLNVSCYCSTGWAGGEGVRYLYRQGVYTPGS